jgi:cell division protein FtsB
VDEILDNAEMYGQLYGLFIVVFFFVWGHFDHKSKKQKKENRRLNDRIEKLEKQIKNLEK